ncbi:MAG: TIGR04083 family peptide-modifying radical SAM enzyme [Methanobrevibacter sp.]|nr:TIGR04083 family peptide-modifying radical SAM enzyme [Candidatus Methanovirga procula]
MTFHVMIIPTLNCPSNCKYCWGSEKKSEMMDIQVIKEIDKWLGGFRDDYVHFTFHGGEPLIAGYDFYKEALPILKNSETHKEAGFSLQSNLWLLDEKLAKLFSDYNVAISTSIDGPKEINDYQRGEGYFDKTMKGYNIAIENGVNVSFISTFTSYSKDFRDEIYNFFLKNGYNFKLHAALPSLRGNNADNWALTPKEHGELLIGLLNNYLNDLDKIEIKDFDHICKSSFIRRGTLCTFADCMGDTLAIGWDGNIYPCYRFVGMKDYIMGNVYNHPSMDELMKSNAWNKLMEFKNYVDDNCNDCDYVKFCRGGCPYNGIVSSAENNSNSNDNVNSNFKNESSISIDPQCLAYKMIFKEVSNRANKEFLKSNMNLFTNNNENKTNKFSIMDLMLKK